LWWLFGFWFYFVMKESDLHTKRTGHTEFADKTAEVTKPISLEVPKAAAMDIDEPAAADASTSSQPEGTIC
jgi:hypothetical protein